MNKQERRAAMKEVDPKYRPLVGAADLVIHEYVDLDDLSTDAVSDLQDKVESLLTSIHRGTR